MQVVCTNPNGFKLHLDDFRDGNEVVLREGVNEVDDAFAARWFALHRDGSHVLPMIADGSIYELLPEPEPKGESKKAATKKDETDGG